MTHLIKEDSNMMGLFGMINYFMALGIIAFFIGISGYILILIVKLLRRGIKALDLYIQSKEKE